MTSNQKRWKIEQKKPEEKKKTKLDDSLHSPDIVEVPLMTSAYHQRQEKARWVYGQHSRSATYDRPEERKEEQIMKEKRIVDTVEAPHVTY